MADELAGQPARLGLPGTAGLPQSRYLPRLILFSELAAEPLAELLEQPGVLDIVRRYGGTLAMALCDHGPARIELVRRLREQEIALIAWLQPDQEGAWLNLQNYPQAITGYQRFRAWATEHELEFAGVGLDMRLPLVQLEALYENGISGALQMLWESRWNQLFPAARSAYRDLFAEMRLHGYEVHTFHLPSLIDDRIAGTTLVQRALNMVYLPADVEALLCYSVFPFRPQPLDTGGALVFGYGGFADAIAVGGAGHGEATPLLTWPMLRRDLLLASHFTDTIYIFSLEALVAQDLLAALRGLDWQAKVAPDPGKRALLIALRSLMISWLLLVRFTPVLFGWAGWVVAAVLLLQRFRQRRARR